MDSPPDREWALCYGLGKDGWSTIDHNSYSADYPDIFSAAVQPRPAVSSFSTPRPKVSQPGGPLCFKWPPSRAIARVTSMAVGMGPKLRDANSGVPVQVRFVHPDGHKVTNVRIAFEEGEPASAVFPPRPTLYWPPGEDGS